MPSSECSRSLASDLPSSVSAAAEAASLACAATSCSRASVLNSRHHLRLGQISDRYRRNTDNAGPEIRGCGAHMSPCAAVACADFIASATRIRCRCTSTSTFAAPSFDGWRPTATVVAWRIVRLVVMSKYEISSWSRGLLPAPVALGRSQSIRMSFEPSLVARI